MLADAVTMPFTWDWHKYVTLCGRCSKRIVRCVDGAHRHLIGPADHLGEPVDG